ncbi:S9 family peptidase [Halalkalibacillus halophilus]|uniref:S9 family peptidase n=1 Tax=Halalkalibacillus halophilus TaxID=392827 RepID=UPI0004034E61|nr:S9 family peptidase [Halalkalibacillus halophilus]
MKPPIAKRIPHPHDLHGDVREDDYYWMRDRNNPDVIDYLEAENRYFDEVMTPLKTQTDKIYERMIERVPDSESEAPVQHGNFFYYSRIDKDLQYSMHARKKAASREQLADASEEVTLDVNELAETSDYLNVTIQRVSADHRLLAYLENRDGSDRYTLKIKNLETGEHLADTIPNVYLFGSMEWSYDGQYIFYVTVDEQQRPYRLWRHQLGTNIDQDELIYEEVDTTFVLHIFKSQSGKFIFVETRSKTTTEMHMIDAHDPQSGIQLIDARRKGIEYDVEHWGDDLLILTNEGAVNFQLLRCPLDNLQFRENVVAYNENRYLLAMYPFRDSLFLYGRENGLTQIWYVKDGELVKLEWDEPLYTVSVESGQSYEAEEVIVHYQSLLTPKTTYSISLKTGERHQLQVAPVSGDYDPSDYRQAQWWAKADDGVSVPMTVVYREGALDSGTAPLILDGYGSYGATEDPHFNPYRLPVLNQGVVFVTAQVRGGSEMGRHWYEDGKMQQKRNTFTDFVAVANYLINEGYTTPGQLAAVGGSAGGMLVGAVANMAGNLFKVIVPAVPFVDVVTTMLDETIPLTTLEWDEWGDPRTRDDYFYMKSYSPYDNVEAKAYPHLYITTGLNDPRVAFWEPAKWVARLRTFKTDDHTIVLKTNMGAGHYGASGRFNHLKEAAETYAFVLDKIGVTVE